MNSKRQEAEAHRVVDLVVHLVVDLIIHLIVDLVVHLHQSKMTSDTSQRHTTRLESLGP